MYGDDEDGSGVEDGEDVEPVFDLKHGADSSDDEDADFDEEDEDDDGDGDFDEDDDSEDEEARKAAIEREEKLATAWGKKKSTFYDHDAEVEIDDEAAKEEGEEALRLQRKRAAEMSEDDIAFGFAALAPAAGKAGKGADKGKGAKQSGKGAGSAAAGTIAQAIVGKTAGSSGSSKSPSAAAAAAAVRAGAGADASLMAALGSSKSLVERVAKDTANMSTAAKREAVLADTPELLGLLQELGSKCAEVREVVAPVLEAVTDGRAATAKGLSYLESKNQLLLMYLTNIVFYLLLKAEGKSVKDHPVIAQLVYVRALLDKLRPLDAKLQWQITKLLKAAAAADASLSARGGDAGSEDDGVDYSDLKGHPRKVAADAAAAAAAAASDGGVARPNPSALLAHGDKPISKKAGGKSKGKREEMEDEDDAEEGEGEGEVDEDGVYRPVRRSAVLYDGDKGASKALREAERRKKRLAKSAMLADLRTQYSEAPEEMEADGAGGGPGRAGDADLDRISSERTAYEEDMMTRLTMSKDEKKARKARERERQRWSSIAEMEQFGDLDELARQVDEQDEGLRGPAAAAAGGRKGRSLAQLDAELRARERTSGSVASAAASGMASGVGRKQTRVDFASSFMNDDDDGDDDDGRGGFGGSDEDDEYGGGRLSGRKRGRSPEYNDEDGGEDPFYAAVAAAAAKKKARKAARAAEEEEEQRDYIRSRPDEDELHDPSGHRKVNKAIMNNRGLVKYRKKEERNPRVHNRKKAEKFVKRRKGQVASLRDHSKEAGRYGGEETGIRTAISRSRKIRS